MFFYVETLLAIPLPYIPIYGRLSLPVSRPPSGIDLFRGGAMAAVWAVLLNITLASLGGPPIPNPEPALALSPVAALVGLTTRGDFY